MPSTGARIAVVQGLALALGASLGCVPTPGDPGVPDAAYAADAMDASAAGSADPHVAAVTDRFALRSDPRVALHHFLLAWAAADADEWPFYAPPIREREGWRDSLPAADAEVWAASVAAYGAARGRSLLFDPGMRAVRDWAADVGPRSAISAQDQGLASALESALPVYLRRWWPVHDRRNRAWIAAVAPALDAVEEAVVPRLEAAYCGTWPPRSIPIDVMVHANGVGAYSVGGRIAISSWNRRIVMPHAIDLVFHEASHVEGLEAPLAVAIEEAFRAAGGEAPESLWHDAIFFTTGEVLRQVMEERGDTAFRPYAEAAGVYERGERWDRELPAFRRFWLPFLRSGSSDPVLRQNALAGLARTLLGRAPDGPLSGLAFLAGCWRGEFDDGAALEEFYTSPSDNLILGVSRFMRGSRTVQHEFSRITADSTGILLLPFPGGRPSEHAFRLTRLEPGRAVFEAPEHDFPKRILYWRNPDGSNTARIDGGEGAAQAQEWRTRPVPCPDGPNDAD